MNILVTAAGCPGFITMCKSLKAIKTTKPIIIHGCDMNGESFGLKFADKSFAVPRGDSENYVDSVFSYCKKNKIDLLIPASDTELIPLSENKDLFKSINCQVLVSPLDSLKTILNKSDLYDYCLADEDLLKIVPRFKKCHDLKSLSSVYADFTSSKTQTCIKPVKAHGSRGFRVISTLESKEDFFNKKASANSITFDNLHQILSQGDENFPDLLLMEYLPGEEFSVDCVSYKNNFYCITRRRDTIKDGICSSGTAIKKDDLAAYSEMLYRKLNLSSNVNIQFRYDMDGNPKLLEINPRVSGTMELCRGAGINMLEASIYESLGLSLPEGYFKVQWGTKMQRVWEEVFFYKDEEFMLESVKSVIGI